MKNVTFSLNQLVIDNMNEFCKEHNISKSSFVSTAITSYITVSKIYSDKPSLLKLADEYMQRFSIIEPYLSQPASQVPKDILEKMFQLRSDILEHRPDLAELDSKD